MVFKITLGDLIFGLLFQSSSLSYLFLIIDLWLISDFINLLPSWKQRFGRFVCLRFWIWGERWWLQEKQSNFSDWAIGRWRVNFYLNVLHVILIKKKTAKQPNPFWPFYQRLIDKDLLVVRGTCLFSFFACFYFIGPWWNKFGGKIW